MKSSSEVMARIPQDSKVLRDRGSSGKIVGTRYLLFRFNASSRGGSVSQAGLKLPEIILSDLSDLGNFENQLKLQSSWRIFSETSSLGRLFACSDSSKIWNLKVNLCIVRGR